MSTIQRQTSSCLFGLEPFLKDRFEEKSIESDELDIFGENENNISNTLNEIDNEFEPLLKKLSTIDKFDPKLEQLKKLIREKKQMEKNKILLFSTFIHTLKYLYANLSDTGIRIGLIYGNIKDIERNILKERFSNSKSDEDAIDILLSSEIGCEGLDFQFCDLLVNYDIPWNPMKIEQRIGRIDRFGQNSEVVEIINFITPGTIDAEIYNRCYQRIGIFENSIGSSEEILGSITEELNKITSNLKLTEAEKKDKLQQLSDNKIREAKELEDLEKKDVELFGLNLPNKNWEDELNEAENVWLSKSSIQFIVENYLKSKINKSKDYIIGDKKIKSLRLSKDERGKLLQDFNDENKLKKDKNYRRFVNWLKNESDAYLKTSFENDDFANEPIEILNVLHPLVRQAADYFEIKVPLNINISTNEKTLPKGKHAFGIYSWQKVGITNNSNLVAICDNKEIEKKLLDCIIDAKNSSHTKILNEEQKNLIKDIHFKFWTQNVSEFVEINKSVINKKIETLNISFQNYKHNFENQISKIKDNKILFMKERQISKRASELESKTQMLNSKLNEVDILQKPLVYGFLEVI